MNYLITRGVGEARTLQALELLTARKADASIPNRILIALFLLIGCLTAWGGSTFLMQGMSLLLGSQASMSVLPSWLSLYQAGTAFGLMVLLVSSHTYFLPALRQGVSLRENSILFAPSRPGPLCEAVLQGYDERGLRIECSDEEQTFIPYDTVQTIGACLVGKEGKHGQGLLDLVTTGSRGLRVIRFSAGNIQLPQHVPATPTLAHALAILVYALRRESGALLFEETPLVEFDVARFETVAAYEAKVYRA